MSVDKDSGKNHRQQCQQPNDRAPARPSRLHPSRFDARSDLGGRLTYVSLRVAECGGLTIRVAGRRRELYWALVSGRRALPTDPSVDNPRRSSKEVNGNEGEK